MEQHDVSRVEVFDDNYNLVTDPEEAVALMMDRVISGEIRSLPVNTNIDDINRVWNFDRDITRQD